MSNDVKREVMKYDVVIVGAGPAGLATAIKLKQLNKDFSVCVLEKGAEIGSHIISGAVIETKALEELIPEWKNDPDLEMTKVNKEEFLFLGKTTSFKIPTFLLPSTIKNTGNFITSLANLCRWLSKQGEKLGVEIYPGFPAK